MDQTGLLRPTPSWNGPKGSTFSPDWKDSLTFLTPDVIKPPPASQPMADLHRPQGVFISAAPGPAVPPLDQKNGLMGTKVEPGYATVAKNRRGRPVSAIDPHRRSQSLCSSAAEAAAAAGGDPVTLRRRCESYAMAYPSSSSDDSGSDSASTRKGEQLLPDAVPRPRVRSIILRKLKRRPAPPERTVSLGKHGGERRCQSLYIPRDLHSTLLPDLIPIAKLEDGEQSPLPTDTATATATAKLKPSVSLTNSRPLNELRSSEPCKAQPCSIPPPPPAPAPATSETAKTPSSSDSLNSPTSSCRSSPSQPPATSPSKPAGSTSPSSGYSSQCDTPTGSVRTAAIFGPSPMGCRMRPKPAGQKSRASRVRLSLQLPETAPPVLDEPADPAKPSRRYSDSSANVKSKQRCLSMLLPVVTQEDLQNVRLRSVSSSDNEGGRFEVFADAIAEEAERDTQTPSIESPKNKPPVAPKPAASTWQPIVAGQNDQSESQESQSGGPEKRRAPIPKPKRSSLSLSGGAGDYGDQPNLSRVLSCNVSDVQFPNNNTFPGQNTDSHFCDSNDKKRTGPPPVARKPEVLILPNGHGMCNKDGITGYMPANGYQDLRLVNGNNMPMPIPKHFPTEHTHGKYNTMGRNPSSDKHQNRVPHPGMTQHSAAAQDDAFVSKTSSRTTEDLFTIIHRSKRKLLGRKDSFEGRPSDLGMQTLGGAHRPSSQNDSFMALLRRTRSAKAAPAAGRISAAELLRSSKPPTTVTGQAPAMRP